MKKDYAAGTVQIGRWGTVKMYIDSQTGLLVVNIGDYSKIDDPASPEHEQLMSCRDHSPVLDDAVFAYPATERTQKQRRPEPIQTWDADHPILIMAVGVDTIDSNRPRRDRPMAQLIDDKYQG